MSCKRYVNQDECRYYPIDCYNCENSYSYTLEDEEIIDDEKLQGENNMIEIKLNCELLLSTTSYNNLIAFINELKKNDNFDINQSVRIYIDSTSNYDYLMRIESNNYDWEWHIKDYDVTMGYVVVMCKLDDLMNHIRMFNINID